MADSLLPRSRWQADVHAALIEILEGEPGVLCLDWDETCAAGDIGEALLDYLDPSGAQMRAYEQTLESGNVLKAYVESIYVLAGMAPEEALEACEGTVDWAIQHGRVVVRPEMMALIAAAQRREWDVWVVTASVTPLVQVFARRYGVPAHRVLGMNLVVENGVYQRALSGPATYREGKVEAIQEAVGRMPTLSVGDTLTDLEMLMASTHGLVIGPRHPDLWKGVEERGWLCQPAFEAL